MKLGKLLGAGKSFFGWQGAIAYRRNKRVYLPKFNPGSNPFTPKTAKAEADTVSPMLMPALSPASVAAAVALVPASVFQVEKTSAPAPAAPKPSVTAATPFSSAVTPARQPNWADKIFPFRGSKPARAAAPVAMPNVQPEFTLSAVKVVHNDLSDAEVEVVPMKSRSAAPAPVSGEPVPMEFLSEPVLKSI